MNKKTQRLIAIKNIISVENINNQEVLLDKLKTNGFDLTQATLSRDLTFLNVTKLNSGNGISRYILPEESSNSATIDPTGFKSLEFSGNFGMIRTIPGYANMLASLIDKRRSHEIIGTIAGDDTILIIPKDGASKEDVTNRIEIILAELRK